MRKELTCPLGAECDECKWLMKLSGQDPMTGKDIERNECAMVALVLTLNQLNFNSLQIMEANQQTRNAVVGIIEQAKKKAPLDNKRGLV